jgi:hypothetical protein
MTTRKERGRGGAPPAKKRIGPSATAMLRAKQNVKQGAAKKAGQAKVAARKVTKQTGKKKSNPANVQKGGVPFKKSGIPVLDRIRKELKRRK